MEIIALLVFAGVVFFIRKNDVENVNSLVDDVNDLQARIKILEEQLQDKVATRSDLYNLEVKLSKTNDHPFDPMLDIP